jgi:WD40 repeat protein
MTAALDIDHPWPGPDSFRAQDAPFFRGRDTEIGQLLRLIRQTRSVVLYGASGLGKTSLINAGVMPRLDGNEYFAVPVRICYVRDALSVSEQLQADIIACSGGREMPKPRPGRTAWELLHLRDEPIKGAQPLLIFDQFEELFTIGTGTPQAAQLVEELKGLIEGVPPTSVRERLEQYPDEARSLSFQRNDHRVLVSIREDFLYGLESLRAQLPSIIHNRFRLGPLSGNKALDVVMQRPLSTPDGAEDTAAADPLLVESDAAELIVRTVASSVPDDRPLDALEVEPALLSILCAELARRRPPGTRITRNLVTGSKVDIISSFYERALHDTPDAVRAYIEDQLVTATGFRTSCVEAEALESVPGFTTEVLSDLVSKRLLRVTERPNGKWLELTHDVLTEVAARSRKLRQERLREQRERDARAEQERAEKLARAARDRKRRGRVLAVVGGLVLALGVVGYSYWAELRLRRAADDAKHALRRQFIDASLHAERHREALAQLAAAVKEEPNAAWARALAGDLLLRRGWPLPAAPLFPKGPFTSLDCNWHGTRCAAAYRDGRVLVRGDLSLDLRTDQRGYGGLSMSEDGGRLTFVPERPGTVVQWTLGPSATEEFRFPLETTETGRGVSSDGQVVVLPTDRDLIVWRPGVRSMPLRIQRRVANAPFALSRDGAWLAYEEDVGTIAVVSTTGGQPVRRSVPRNVRLRIDPKSKVLFAALEDGTLQRWSLPDVSELQPLQARRPILWIYFDMTGDQMALELEGGGLELWTEPSREPRVMMRSSPGVQGVGFAPDGQWLAVATRDGVVSSWSSSGAPLGEPLRLNGLAFVAALESRGLLGVSLGGDSARWVMPTLRTPRQHNLGEPATSAWFLSEDAIFARGDSRWLERLGDKGEPAALLRHSLYFSRDRTHTATAYRNGLYARQGLPVGQNSDDADQLLDVAKMDNVVFSGNGRRLAAAGAGKGYLFNLATRERIGTPIDDVSAVWLNDDGTMLATKKSDVGLTLWRLAADGLLTRLRDIDTLVVSHVAFNPKSDALVLATENQALVWSLTEERFRGRPVAHDGPILDAEFSPDGRWIVTASADTRARIWEAASGLPASDWFEHDRSVTAASFSPSGKKLLTASTDGLVRIWELPDSADTTDQERLWLARLAELLSGMRIDLATNEALPAPQEVDAFEALRQEIEAKCPRAVVDRPGCASGTTGLIRTMLDNRGVGVSPPAAGAR